MDKILRDSDYPNIRSFRNSFPTRAIQTQHLILTNWTISHYYVISRNFFIQINFSYFLK